MEVELERMYKALLSIGAILGALSVMISALEALEAHVDVNSRIKKIGVWVVQFLCITSVYYSN